MKHILITTILLLALFSSNAQIAFVKGYIVNEKDDTLKGEIKINPKKVQDCYSKVFFKDESGAQKNYKANKLKGYGFDKENYVSMEYEGEPKFYKALERGDISLYKVMFEVVNMNETTYDNEYYITTKDKNKLTLVKEAKFKKQLQDLVSDASDYASDYEGDKKLNEEKAVEVINRYNKRKN